MVNKTYKQKYEELLKSQNVDKKIDKHTNSYIHISFSWKSIGTFCLMLLLGLLSWLNFLLIVRVGYVFKAWELLKETDLSKIYHSFYQLIIIYPMVGEYILISLTVICLVALIKGGFDKLKSYSCGGLIKFLIVGFIFGLITPLICVLVLGWFTRMVVVIIAGLIVGLIGGLIFATIAGLIEEFS